MSSFYDSVHQLVREIPAGRVMTYGQIATILGAPRAARAVGYAMRAAAPTDIPWQRVINGKGEISGKDASGRPELQRELLDAEGVEFNAAGACDLKRFRWEPENPEAYRFEGNIDLDDLPFR